MPSIEDAIMLATLAHRGQKDKAGLPYILHPLRVMSSFVLPEEDNERIVAVLHDVVEDTNTTMETLVRNYSSVIVEAIDAISRRKKQLETYEAYIERVALNPLATRVKWADLLDNLDTRRHSTKMLTTKMLDKYRRAELILRGKVAADA